MKSVPYQLQPQAFVGLMEALAEPTRLRLLRLLDRQELGVTEMCEVLQLPQSTVSRHLKNLSETGWLDSRRRGTSNLYRMRRGLSDGARHLWEVAREETKDWSNIRQDQRRLAHHLESQRSDTRRFFSGAANTWDATRRGLYGDGFMAAAAFALMPKDWCVVDLGCGTGYLSAMLAPRVARVIGVDESGAMLAVARTRTAGFGNVELVEGSLESVPLGSGLCDGALLLLTLLYVSDPPAVLQEMRRVLRPGGQGVIVDLLPHDDENFTREMGHFCSGFGPDELGGMLADAGFTNVRINALSCEPEARGPALFLAAVERPLDDDQTTTKPNGSIVTTVKATETEPATETAIATNNRQENDS